MRYIFSAFSNMFMSTSNMEHPTFKARARDWLPYAAVFKNLEFISIQRYTQSFSGHALIKPYDLKGWSSVVVIAAFFKMGNMWAEKAYTGDIREVAKFILYHSRVTMSHPIFWK